jgi:hypothetical protein
MYKQWEHTDVHALDLCMAFNVWQFVVALCGVYTLLHIVLILKQRKRHTQPQQLLVAAFASQHVRQRLLKRLTSVLP